MKLDKETFNTYVKENVFKTITDYNLICEDDNIMIGISGGKDSILTLHMINQYQKENDINFQITAVCVDEGIAGYRENGIKTAITNCQELKIPLNIVSFKEEFGYNLDEISSLFSSSCMPCGIYRRYLLNKISDKYHCDKIATGHNLDDEIQSFLMTFARNDRQKFTKFSPILDKIHENMVPRIKPLWQLAEKDVAIWCILNNIPIHDEECPYSKTSLRSDVKLFLNKLEEDNKGIKRNIFESFKKTLQFPKVDVELTNCKICNQATATSPCQACKLTNQINKMVKE